MSKFQIQRYRAAVTVPINDNSITDTPASLNGILRGIVINAPTLTGSSYSVTILGTQGETLYSKASLSAATKTVIVKDADNQYLQIPLAVAGTPCLKILVAGDSDGTGVLTSDQTNALNNETVTVGTITYTFKDTLTGAANEVKIQPNTKATGIITSSNVNVTDGKLVTVNGRAYRFKTVPTQVNDIFIGADADTTLASFAATLNGTGVAGVDMFAGTTINADVTASGVTAHAITLTAKSNVPATGNNITLTTDEPTYTLSGLSGGKLSGAAYTGDTTLENLEAALNGEAGAGTLYGTGTVANPAVTSSEVASHALTVTGTAIPDTGTPTSSTSVAFTWGAAYLVGGGEASARTFTCDLLVQRG